MPTCIWANCNTTNKKTYEEINKSKKQVTRISINCDKITNNIIMIFCIMRYKMLRIFATICSQVRKMRKFITFNKTQNEDITFILIFTLYRCPTGLIRKLDNQAIIQAGPVKKHKKRRLYWIGHIFLLYFWYNY